MAVYVASCNLVLSALNVGVSVLYSKMKVGVATTLLLFTATVLVVHSVNGNFQNVIL